MVVIFNSYREIVGVADTCEEAVEYLTILHGAWETRVAECKFNEYYEPTEEVHKVIYTAYYNREAYSIYEVDTIEDLISERFTPIQISKKLDKIITEIEGFNTAPYSEKQLEELQEVYSKLIFCRKYCLNHLKDIKACNMLYDKICKEYLKIRG